MALLRAYYDESGVHSGSKVTVVAGFISSQPRWLKFEKKWRQVLKQEGVSAFHMNQFAHRTGEFNRWTELRRISFLEKLIALTEGHIQRAFAHGVLTTDFQSVKAEAKFKDIKISPYQLCCKLCIMALIYWSNRIPGNDSIAVFFAEGNVLWNEQMRVFEKIYKAEKTKVNELNTAKSDAHIQFQASDLLAYELYLHNERRRDPNYRPRKSLHALLKKIKLSGFLIHPDIIRQEFDDLIFYGDKNVL